MQDQYQNNLKRETPNQPHRSLDDDEIDLIEYLKVIIKRKKLIIAIFLISTVSAALISYFVLPKQYEAISLIKIGIVRGQALEGIENIKVIFKSEATLQKIANKLNLPENTPPEIISQKFSIDIEGESNLLKIKGKNSTPEESILINQVIFDLIQERHQELFELAKKTLGTEIKNIQEKITENQKQVEESNLFVQELEQEKTILGNKIAKLENTRSEAQARIAEAYINSLDQVNLRFREEKTKLESLKVQQINLNNQLQQKEYEKAYKTRMTAIEIPALTPERAVSPRPVRNTGIAGIMGLFLGVLAAFGIEYFNAHKNELK